MNKHSRLFGLPISYKENKELKTRVQVIGVFVWEHYLLISNATDNSVCH